MYDNSTSGGAKLAVAISKAREAIAELDALRTSALAKAYADRANQDPETPPVFTRMVEEFGVADGETGQALYDRMSSIVLAFGPDAVTAGAAGESVKLLDKFA